MGEKEMKRERKRNMERRGSTYFLLRTETALIASLQILKV